jgi:hypothetical protein
MGQGKHGVEKSSHEISLKRKLMTAERWNRARRTHERKEITVILKRDMDK